MEQLLSLYTKMLKLHIGTKTTDLLFHQASEWFYDLGFKLFHTISEKRQDLGLDPSIDFDDAGSSAMSILEAQKEIIEGMIKEKNSAGMDNLLRALADELEFAIGTAKGFVKEEEKEEIEEIDDSKELPKLGIKTPLQKR